MLKVELKNEKVIVKADYCPQLVAGAKKIGGKFNYNDTAWIFSIDEIDLVKKLLLKIYGEDGFEKVEKVKVRINLDNYEDDRADLYNEVSEFGRVLLRRKYRDSDVFIHETVIIEEGGFCSSGGSVKNVRLAPLSGTILYVKDVPLKMAEKLADEYPSVFEIIKNNTPTGTEGTSISSHEIIEIFETLAKEEECITPDMILNICASIKNNLK